MRFICEEINCVGCSACQLICPKKCISMTSNDEGFLYPKIDNNICINCGKCGKVCPVVNSKPKDNSNLKTVGAYCIDNDIRISSSSGGIFTLLAESIMEEGGLVVGPIFDKNLNLIHQITSSQEDIKLMRGSKYVQSNLKNIFAIVEEKLNNGEKLLFTGTPCQIAGLKSFLKKEYNNLYTQDIVCHGVPSPYVFKKYISFLEEKYNSKVSSFNFRNKDTGWNSYSIKVTFENGKTLSELAKDNMYFMSYIMGVQMRECCAKCKFKQSQFTSDLTLGDLWGLESINPSINDNKGVSLIMIHTEKGQKLFDRIENKISSFPVKYDDALKCNPSIINSSKHSPDRQRFLKDANKTDFEKLFKKYCGKSLLSRIRRKLVNIVSR